MLGLAHRPVLLAVAEDAFDHRAAALRHAIALMPCGAPVDGAFALASSLGRRVVLRHVRRHPSVAQRRYKIGGVVSLIRTVSMAREISPFVANEISPVWWLAISHLDDRRLRFWAVVHDVLKSEGQAWVAARSWRGCAREPGRHAGAADSSSPRFESRRRGEAGDQAVRLRRRNLQKYQPILQNRGWLSALTLSPFFSGR